MCAGEGHRQDIDDIVAAALEYYGEKGQLDDTPLPVALERDRDPRLAASPLRFPGGFAAIMTSRPGRAAPCSNYAATFGGKLGCRQRGSC